MVTRRKSAAEHLLVRFVCSKLTEGQGLSRGGNQNSRKKRHPHRGYIWCRRRYWRFEKGNSRFSDGRSRLRAHADTPIRRHTKVQGTRSPFDGDWLYWGTRLGKDPTKPDSFTTLLKEQQGRCKYCGALFTADDIIEVHHKNGNRNDNYRRNLALLHGHCHDQQHAAFATKLDIDDNNHFTEEPCARKQARTVLEQRGER